MLVCGAAAARAESLQPAGWDASLKLPEAQDINPDPKIVEINLEARLASLEIVPGVKTEVWTYNGGVPGPLIRVRRGDRLIVHFSNKLDKSTTVHWHGVQVPIEMDGVPVELKNREYDLALFLFQNMGRLLSRDHLKEIVWGQVADVMSRSLDTHISRLRTLLDLRPANGFIVTAVYGVGYRFEAVEAQRKG